MEKYLNSQTYHPSNEERLADIQSARDSLVKRIERISSTLGDNADWAAICKVLDIQFDLWSRRGFNGRLVDPLLHVMPYRQYLETEHWKCKSANARIYAGHKCSLCNTEGELHCHHRTYERRGSEIDQDLIVLCAECHAKFHDKLPREEIAT